MPNANQIRASLKNYRPGVEIESHQSLEFGEESRKQFLVAGYSQEGYT